MKQSLKTFIALTTLLCSSVWYAPATAKELMAAIIIADLPRYQQTHDAMAEVLLAKDFNEDKLKIFKQNPSADKMSLTNNLRRAELEEKGKAFGFKIVVENVRNPKEAKALGDKLMAEVEGLFLTESVAVAGQASSLLASAQNSKCILFSQIPGLVEMGALFGLEADLEEQGKLVTVHALQVLQGKKVHLLPVREAKKRSLKINEETVTRLGLTIPPEVATKAKLM